VPAFLSSSSVPRSPQNRSVVLAIILGSYLMVVLDISVVITALPKIHHALHFSSTGLSWVQSAYALTFGGLLLLGARAGDILGRRRVFLAGTALFSVTWPNRRPGSSAPAPCKASLRPSPRHRRWPC
jgi:MFS family permease